MAESGRNIDVFAFNFRHGADFKVDRMAMVERIILNELKEEWRTSATRHKVGIVVLALVIFGVMLFAPPERKAPHRSSLVVPAYYLMQISAP